jgi:UDPglucose 6-dehydrogenase
MTSNNTSVLKIGFVGMSHLGLITSTALTSKGCISYCYDPNSDLINNLSRLIIDVSEPGLIELIKENSTNQIFTSNISDLNACDLVYISADVPTDESGEADLNLITQLILSLKGNLIKSIPIVILSQVSPGYTRRISSNFENTFFYQVETLIFGDAVNRSLKPERFIVGSSSPSEPLVDSFSKLLKIYDCPVLIMNYESAELAKISINLFLASNIAMTNTIAEICEKTGADWISIMEALKMDARIGKHSYLRPGLGISGGNIERDLKSISTLAKKYGTESSLVDAISKNSQYRKKWAITILNDSSIVKNSRALVGFWGLAYKENTNSIKNSPAVATILSLPQDMRIIAHDPEVKTLKIHRALEYCQEPDGMLDQVEVLVILTPWDEYKKYGQKEYVKRLQNKVVIDPFGLFDRALCEEFDIKHFVLGQISNSNSGVSINEC